MYPYIHRSEEFRYMFMAQYADWNIWGAFLDTNPDFHSEYHDAIGMYIAGGEI